MSSDEVYTHTHTHTHPPVGVALDGEVRRLVRDAVKRLGIRVDRVLKPGRLHAHTHINTQHTHTHKRHAHAHTHD